MRRTLLGFAIAAAVALASPVIADTRLTGSGASFPFPIYSAWFKAFSAETDGVTVDYQSKGSGAGIQDLINKVVDFAASDAAMKDEDIAKVEGGVVLLPMTAGEIVLAYNLPGVGELKLPRDVYPAIFFGEITNWNDPRIAAANEGVTLPDMPITVVVRSDSSRHHLQLHQPSLGDRRGVQGRTRRRHSVQWPASDKIVKAPKNDGVTATIMQTPGAIGYIEYGYAKLTGTPMATLENASGEFIAPGGKGGQRSARQRRVRRPHARLHHRSGGRERLSDRHVHLDAVLRARARIRQKVDALKQMVDYGSDRWPGDGRGTGLYPAAEPL